MEKLKNRIKRVLRIFWEYKYSITAAVLIICVVLGAVHYKNSGSVAWGNLSFNYSEASNGLNPNNTRFNSYEILSSEVLERAIELSGLDGSISADELSSHVNASPVDTGNASGDNNYISTTYSLSINTKNLDVKNRTAKSILENIGNAYKEYFLENNGDNQEILKNKLEKNDEIEPYLRLNEIKLRANQLKRYLDSRMSQSRAFIDEKSSMSFDELEKRLKNITDYDIPNVSSFIVERGVAQNSERLAEILEYKNRIKTVSADKQAAYYEADKNGIAMYEKLMSSIVMIPTYDETGEYYMSRTKTAMDKMARNADASLTEAMSFRKETVNTQYVAEKMKKSVTTKEELASAVNMTQRLENALNLLADDLIELDNAYIEYKNQNYITFNYYEQSFIQRISIKKICAEALFLLMIFAAVVYFETVREEKNEK